MNVMHANYSVYYAGAKVGKIDTLDTIKNNYIKIKITSYILKKFLNKKYFIYHTENYFPQKNQKNIYFKKDKYKIIDILKQSIYDTKPILNEKIHLSKNKYLTISKKEDYSFEYFKNNKRKTYGTYSINNNSLVFLKEKSRSITIKKNP